MMSRLQDSPERLRTGLFRKATHVAALLMLVVFTGSCSVQKNPVTGSTRLLAWNWNQEVQIGQEVDKELVAQYGLYDDDEVAKYVHDIGKVILAESHMRREDTDRQFRETEFFFRVLDSPVVNAFALPGGYVYVTRGLMVHMNNEAQLAVVIGHEIGHVAARHASQRALRQTLGQIAIIGGAVLGQEFLGLPGESILNLSSQAAQLIFLSYSRDAERESDRLGVEYSAMAGYDAAEGAAFFTSLKRLSDQAGHSIPTMLSSHPDPGERERAIPRMAAEWTEKGYEQTITNKDRYFQMIDGMLYGDNPREGFVDDGQFVHPELAFRFPVPQQWQVINQRHEVILLSGAQDAVMILRIDGQASTARESVQSFIGQEGIQINSQSETRSSEQYTAYEADVTIPQREGDLRALVYAVEFDGRVYRFINYTTTGKWDGYAAALRQVPGQFDRLTDRRLLDVKPVRLSVVAAPRADQFRNLLPSALPMGITAEEMAIVNQVQLDEEIPAGRKLKFPVQ
jgi:predicted Zn-dependent protease